MSNYDIYNIFKKNKIILLYLIEEKIITIDQEIITKMTQNEDQNYKEYFKPEIQQNYQSKEMPDLFIAKRRKGENDSHICEIIRNDNVVEFIVLHNKNEISLTMEIPTSIYETNSFLIKNTPTLIEYSAFFGSIQIFNYLRMNGIQLTSSLWLYAIHGKNPEIIHLLEENDVEHDDKIYYKCHKESIKCHHQDLEMHYKDNFIKETFDNSYYFENDISYGFHFYNFNLIPTETQNKYCFYYSVDYDYYKLVDYYYKNIKEMNINELIVFFCSIFL